MEDMALHAHIAVCSHNMVVKTLMPIIDAAVISIANITRQVLLQATIETHGRIVNAILARDPMGARAAMTMHLEMNRHVIMQEQESKQKAQQKT